MQPKVRIIDDFVSDPPALFEQARAELPWRCEMKARQTASVGLAYNYSGIRYPDVSMPDWARTLCDQVQAVVGHPITNILVNYYQDGDSTMGWHSDSAEGIAAGTTTSILSLGVERKLCFKRKDDETIRTEYVLRSGSLLVMDAQVQDDWKHAVPRSSTAAARMSLAFRHIASSNS